jgi:outer membrane protein OmpA-like peptidoglycan-associated protein
MAAVSEQLTLTLIFDAGVAFMAAISGGFKSIAPPEIPKIWVLLGTIAASAAFFSAKLLYALEGVPLSRNSWLAACMAFVWAAFVLGIVYVLTRIARTVTYGGETKLAGSPAEYLPQVAADPQNVGKSRDDLVRDAAGVVEHVWPPRALARSRTILGIEYTLFIALLALGLYLGIEAFNAPKPVPTFAERVAKLLDVHFALGKSDLGADAEAILKADAEILSDVFKQFDKATVIVEGYCDDRGTDEYNFVLGYERAEATRNALVGAGIDPKRLTVVSHGKRESTCASHDESCRRQQRRVHLVAVQN